MNSTAGFCVGVESRAGPLLCVLGPTASGKTALSIDLAERFQGEIVVMDSAQIYRGLEIGSAKPSAEEVARVPHRLLGVFAWDDICSAMRWAEHARVAIADIHDRGRLPIICGGTFLYLRALLEGMHELPSSDADLRLELERRADVEGVPVLHAELAKRDPQTASRLHPNDRQRVLRALEILQQAGTGREALIASGSREGGWSGPVLKLALMPKDREELRRRIALRFEQMIAQGLWQEVQAVHDDPAFRGDLPVLKAVGYRQLYAALRGECSADEAIERAIIATRQYAKRQLTWLRKDPDLLWLDSTDRGMPAEAAQTVEKWLLTSAS